MSFISKITSGECSICFLDLGNDAIIHQDGGESHPIHRKCFEIWENTVNQQKVSSCPICHKNITFIETKGNALIRMAKEGDFAAIQVFMKNGPFPICYESAIIVASQEGHYKIVEALLKWGSISNEASGWALQEASKNGHLEVVKALLEKRTMTESIPPVSLEESLKIAKENGHENIVAELELVFQIMQLFISHSRNLGLIKL